jgi:hypothetical protein
VAETSQTKKSASNTSAYENENDFYAVCGQKTTASPAVEEFEKEVASFTLRVSRKIWRA